MLIETPPPASIKAWHRELTWFVLEDAIMLLKRLGGFDKDKVIILLNGYHTFSIIDLLIHFDSRTYCTDIHPIYFDGGPFGAKRYKGTLLTVILDRLLLVSCEKGLDCTLKHVKYAKLLL